MYPRTEYEMTKVDLGELLKACKPVPYMVIGGMEPPSPQENANAAWARLGAKMGFDSNSVRPVDGKGQRFFTAVPNETEDQRTERLAHEAADKRRYDIKRLAAEIADRQKQLDTLEAADYQAQLDAHKV